METPQHKRLYYLDWLRLSAFGLLFLFHSWRPFDHLPWHMKSDDQSVVFDILTMFVHGWRMFLIFLVSGAGTWLAMRAREERFIQDRVNRLLVPFLLSIVVIIPPQRYYEWISFGGFEGSYLDFLWAYPAQQLSAHMGSSPLLWFGHLGTHVWYLPFLFVMTLLALPVLEWIRSGGADFSRIRIVMSTRGGVFVLAVPMILSRLVLKPIYPEYTDWADFFVYLWPFLYGFIFMADRQFLDIVKNRMWAFLVVGSICSATFIFLGTTSEQNVQVYLNPGFSWMHVGISVLTMLIAYSWIMFFLALFARTMNFKHELLIPANTGILPIYVLHQTLIIVFGFYIVQLELPLGFRFLAIALTAIPASVLIYKVIETNNVTRFLFGLKSLPKTDSHAMSSESRDARTAPSGSLSSARRDR